MSKSKEVSVLPASTDPVVTTIADPVPPAAVGVRTLFFRDKLYTSRQVILPDGTALFVNKGVAEVESDNAQAIAHLKAHAEFEPLE